MSDFQVLTAVRGHLLNEQIISRVHLTLPPKAIYPLLLIELEEIWSSYPLTVNDKRRNIQTRIKFKVSVYSRSPGMEEATILSHKLRKVLEGITMLIPKGPSGNKSSTIRFLACVSETSGSAQGGQQLRVIHHFYDCIVWG